MHKPSHSGAILAALLLATSTRAQVSFSEAEPNSLKTEATSVIGIAPNDSITGVSSGAILTPVDSSSTSVDTFRVRTAASPLGIYRHQLTLTSAVPGYVTTIRGLDQLNGVIGTVDSSTQFSPLWPLLTNTNVWYGFGKQEEIYYRVQGTSSTTATYDATFSSTAVTPLAATSTLNAGPIRVFVFGPSISPEFYIYDANLNPVPAGHSAHTSNYSFANVTVPLAAGVYYVAMSDSSVANHVSDLHPLEHHNAMNQSLLDFPDALVCGSSSQNLGMSFTATDGTTSTTVTSTKVASFDVVWGSFTVVGTVPPPVNDDCASALLLTGPTAGYLGSATSDGVSSCDPGGVASKDVWYEDSGGPLGGQLTLSTCGLGGIDTVLSILTACGGVELACSDDCGGSPCGGPTSCVQVALAPNQAVRVRVSDKGLGGNQFFLFRTFVSTPPPNDDCSSPTMLVGPGTYSIDTRSATTGTQGQTEGVCAHFHYTSIFRDVWFVYTATRTGSITVSTCGGVPFTSQTLDDSRIGVYPGTACPSAGTAITCNDNDVTCNGPSPQSVYQSQVTFAGLCGQSYLIQIGSAVYINGGPFNLFNGMLGQFFVTESGTYCPTPSTPFCDGGSPGTTCLGCGNNGAVGRGCGNSVFASGTWLTNTGAASIANDTLRLIATDIPGPGLFFQANGLLSSRAMFGDGMLCAAVGILRLGVVFPTFGFASFPDGPITNLIHLAGGPVSPGDLKHYQVWYRDSAAYCTSSTFNTSNGLSLTWTP